MKKLLLFIFLIFLSLGIHAQCDHPDYEGLMQLYESTNGENWTNNTGWLQGAQGFNCDPCAANWKGVACENDRVVEINLINNGLTGALADFNLPMLKRLNLSFNQISGELVNFTRLAELEVLSVQLNDLTGSLVDFDNIRKIQDLNFAANNFTGPIPDYSNCPVLSALIIDNNPINDTIPNFVRLPNLHTFNCRNSMIQGTLPAFSNNKLLANLDVSNNMLSGPFPLTSDFPNLFRLNCSFNDLSGCYPTIQNCEFIFPSSDFSGNIRMPYLGDYAQFCSSGTQIGAPCSLPEKPGYRAFIRNGCECVIDPCEVEHPDLPMLKKIYEATNGDDWINNTGWKAMMEGYSCKPCDEIFGNYYGITCKGNRVKCIDLDGLVSCDFNGFGGNNLTGEWPADIELKGLELLILDDNNLTGNVPDISKLYDLKELRVSNNHLTGEIPSFENNADLTTVRLSFNNLTGPIPDLSNNFLLRFFTIANNDIEGCYPQWTCNLDLFSAENNSKLPWRGDNSLFCDGVDQMNAPCGDATSNFTIMENCICDGESTGVEWQKDEIVLFPNPASDRIQIQSSNTIYNLMLIDIFGREYHNLEIEDDVIDIGKLAPGVYFLKYVKPKSIGAIGESYTTKFIKI